MSGFFRLAVAELRYKLQLSADGGDLIWCPNAVDLPASLPTPQWRSFTRLDTGYTNSIAAAMAGGTQRHGELLMNVQLIRKASEKMTVPIIPKSIAPAMRERYVDFIVLGCRNLRSVDLFPVERPSVSLDFGGRLMRGTGSSATSSILSTAISRRTTTAGVLM